MTQQIINYDEEMVGANHPTKEDTLNRALLIEHEEDGTHTDGLEHPWIWTARTTVASIYASAWLTQDISSYVPEGTKMVMLNVTTSAAAAASDHNVSQFRKDSSSAVVYLGDSDQYHAVVSAAYDFLILPITTSRTFDCGVPGSTYHYVDAYLVGYRM